MAVEMRAQQPVSSASEDGPLSQLITLAVDTRRGRGEADPVRPALATVRGVEAVEPDPGSARVWVFADGGVEPETLIEALATWGYGAYVLDNELGRPQ